MKQQNMVEKKAAAETGLNKKGILLASIVNGGSASILPVHLQLIIMEWHTQFTATAVRIGVGVANYMIHGAHVLIF